MTSQYSVVGSECLTCGRRTRVVTHGVAHMMNLERNTRLTTELSTYARRLGYVREVLRSFAPATPLAADNLHNTTTQWLFLCEYYWILVARGIYPCIGNLYSFLLLNAPSPSNVYV